MSTFDEIFGGAFDVDAAIESGAEAEREASFEPLPPGWYTCEIEDATEIAPVAINNTPTTRTGFDLRLNVLDEGEWQGRKVFVPVTVADTSADEKDQRRLRIELGRLGALARTCGWRDLRGRTTADFAGKVVSAKVVQWTNKQTGKTRNFVQGWAAPGAARGAANDGGGDAAPTSAARTKAAPSPRPTGAPAAKKMPWQK